jgi:heme A synthase
VTFIHSRIALTAVLFAFVLGVWAGWDFLRGRGVSPSYWGALVIGEILMIAQGVIGAILVLSGALPSDLIHFLYGVLVALAWPGVYVYTHARTGRGEAGWYALVSFFIFGLTIRAIMTGGPLR